jgi:hypothetical protein
MDSRLRGNDEEYLTKDDLDDASGYSEQTHRLAPIASRFLVKTI